VVREPGRAAVKESSFTIGSITVNGTTISYSDKGFRAGDQSPPSQQPPASFFDALKAAGITVEFIPAADTDTSIESAGLRITQVQQMGPATQKVSFVIGHVSARIDGEAAPARNDLLGDTLPAQASSGGGAGGPALAPAPSAAPAGLDAGGSGLSATASTPPGAVVPLPSALAPAVPDLASLPPALEAAAASPARTAPAPRLGAASPPVRLALPAASIGRGLRSDDVSGLYVALGVAAALMALAGFLLPGLGRRHSPAPPRSVLKLP